MDMALLQRKSNLRLNECVEVKSGNGKAKGGRNGKSEKGRVCLLKDAAKREGVGFKNA